MSRGHQIVIATGHLGADPEIKATRGGSLIAEMRMAVTEVYRDRDGQQVEHTEWLRCKLFGRNAETAEKWLRKGRLVTIEGSLRTEKWQANDGSDRYSTWIYVAPHGLTMHGGRDHEQTRREHQGRAEQSPARPPAGHQSSASSAPVDDFADDDIPF